MKKTTLERAVGAIDDELRRQHKAGELGHYHSPREGSDWNAVDGNILVTPLAKAVLRAIREPGHDVYQAGFDAEASANPHKTQPHHVVPAVWQAMIDAALGEN